jgi:hypothetical protein
MVAVAIVGILSGGTIELVRRRQRLLRAYRQQALAEFECSVKAYQRAASGEPLLRTLQSVVLATRTC